MTFQAIFGAKCTCLPYRADAALLIHSLRSEDKSGMRRRLLVAPYAAPKPAIATGISHASARQGQPLRHERAADPGTDDEYVERVPFQLGQGCAP